MSKNNRKRSRYVHVIWLLAYLTCAIRTEGSSLFPYGHYPVITDHSYLAVICQYAVYNGYANQQTRHRFFVQNMSMPAAIARTMHPPETVLIINETSRDFITYTTYELIGNLNIGKFLNFSFSAPWHSNTAYYQTVIETNGVSQVKDTVFEYRGMGGITGMLEFSFTIDHGAAKHNLRPAFGTRLLKGNDVLNRSLLKEDPALLPGLLFPEYIFRLNYRFSLNTSAVDLFFSHGSTRPKASGFRPGNTLDLRLAYLHRFSLHQADIRPEISCHAQEAKAHQLLGAPVPDTDGHRVMAGLGLEISLRHLYFKTLFQRPVYESISGKQLHNAGKLTSAIAYTF